MEEKNELIENYTISFTMLVVGGILVFFLDFENLFKVNNFIFGIFSILGLGGGVSGFIKPNNIFFMTVFQIFSNIGNSQNSEDKNNSNITQSQKNTKNSTQAITKDNSSMNIVNNYYDNKNIPQENYFDEKKNLIDEINKDLNKEKLSYVLLKSLRLANLVGDKEKIIWIETELKGLDLLKINSEIPNYRIVKVEIRVTGPNLTKKYESLDYKIALAQSVTQLEDWIESYDSTRHSDEIILNGPMGEDFKEIYIKNLKSEPPKGDIPYIIKISQLKKVLNGLKLEISKYINLIETNKK
jgi:hypothetical protein